MVDDRKLTEQLGHIADCSSSLMSIIITILKNRAAAELPITPELSNLMSMAHNLCAQASMDHVNALKRTWESNHATTRP